MKRDTMSAPPIIETRALMAQYKELHPEIDFSHNNKNMKESDIQAMWDYINDGLRLMGYIK